MLPSLHGLDHRGHHLVIPVNRKVTRLLVLDYWPSVWDDMGLTNGPSSPNYKKHGKLVPTDKVQTWRNVQVVVGPVVKSWNNNVNQISFTLTRMNPFQVVLQGSFLNTTLFEVVASSLVIIQYREKLLIAICIANIVVNVDCLETLITWRFKYII